MHQDYENLPSYSPTILRIMELVQGVKSVSFWKVWNTINKLPAETTEERNFFLWIENFLGVKCASWDELGARYVELHTRLKTLPGTEKLCLAKSLSEDEQTPWPTLIALDQVRCRCREQDSIETATFQQAIIAGLLGMTPDASFDCIFREELHSRLVLQWWLSKELSSEIRQNRRERRNPFG